MFGLLEKRFVDYFKCQPETGRGYWVATAYLKDGRIFGQVWIGSGYVAKMRGHQDIPLAEADIDRFAVTHEKWRD
jgi:hypothetical protein